jgi:hypothetical protein
MPTKADLEHISHIQTEFDRLVNDKYLNGIKEHGGHLWEKPMEREALDEAIDQVTYLITLRDQVDEVCKLAADALNADDDKDAGKTACLHILQALGRIRIKVVRGKR